MNKKYLPWEQGLQMAQVEKLANQIVGAEESPHFMIIGDIHGMVAPYIKAAKLAKYSLQIGDLGFKGHYDLLSKSKLDSEKHKLLPGNHDDYSEIKCEHLSPDDPEVISPYSPYSVRGGKVYKFHHLPPHFIGNYGTWKVPGCQEDNLVFSNEIFFVRGAWSIDWEHRIPGLDWFSGEQLSYNESQDALKLYQKVRPEVVVTHSCPYSIMSHLRLGYSNGQLIATNTNRMLEDMLSYHQPKLWVFGHFHQEFGEQLGKTLFICVDMYRHGMISSLDFDNRMDIIIPSQ